MLLFHLNFQHNLNNQKLILLCRMVYSQIHPFHLINMQLDPFVVLNLFQNLIYPIFFNFIFMLNLLN